MCFSTAKWQREEVQDYKLDFVDVDEFHKNSFLLRLKYLVVFAIVLKYVLVYIADIWTAGILLIFDRWSSSVQPAIPFFISKWIYVGCIFMSFILLASDVRKARYIIKSRDISYTFTNVVAYRYYTLGSYSHFCFFDKINNSKKIMDNIAFFVFFTFKGWKRLIFAEAPRQIINAITLYSIIRSNKSRNYFNINEYGTDIVQRLAMGLMAFSLVIFTVSASMFIVAFLLYIPLLCQIRGNLKEYCCHKIDKRIGELLKKNSKKRLRKQRQLQARAGVAQDFSHSKANAPMPVLTSHRQPTLPNVEGNQQKIISPVPIPINYSSADRQLQRSDSPYKNNTTVPYNLSGPGYPQQPQQPQQPYTRKTPPPGGPPRGYNSLVAMSEPIPKIHNAKPEPIPQIHVTRSESIPQIHATNSEPIPQKHVTRSDSVPQKHVMRSDSVPQKHVIRPEPVPQKHVIRPEPVPQKHVIRPEPVPQIHVTMSEPVPQIHVTMSEPIPRSDVKMSEPIPRSDVKMSDISRSDVKISELIPPVHRSTPQSYVAALEPVHAAASQPIHTTEPISQKQTQVVQSAEPSYDSADIIDNYNDYGDSIDNGSDYIDNSYSNYAGNNYADNSYYTGNNNSYNSYNYTDNSYNNYNTDNNYNTGSSYDNYNYTSNSYSGHNYAGNNSSQPRIGVDDNPTSNFASNPPRSSNDRYRPSNQVAPQVDQTMYDNYAQQESSGAIEEGYYYAQ